MGLKRAEITRTDKSDTVDLGKTLMNRSFLNSGDRQSSLLHQVLLLFIELRASSSLESGID